MNLTRSEYEAITRAARSLARKEGYGHLADDFAQEACLARARGRNCGLLLIFIDFLRSEYGRTGIRGTPGGLAKSAARHGAEEFDPDRHADGCHERPDAGLLRAERDSEHERLLRRARELLSAREYWILEEAIIRSVPYQLIADELGVTESRVCQIITHAKAKLQEIETHETLMNVLGGDEMQWEVLWVAI